MSPERAEQIIAEARSWIGTPYRHMGNIKGPNGAVDCGMIIIEIHSKVGAFPWFDPRPYPRQFHLHKQDEWYLRLLYQRGPEIPRPVPGCVAIFKMGRLFSHGSVVTEVARREGREDYRIVHAYAHADLVMEEWTGNTPFRRLPVKFFDLGGNS